MHTADGLMVHVRLDKVYMWLGGRFVGTIFVQILLAIGYWYSSWYVLACSNMEVSIKLRLVRMHPDLCRKCCLSGSDSA